MGSEEVLEDESKGHQRSAGVIEIHFYIYERLTDSQTRIQTIILVPATKDPPSEATL